MNWGSSWSAFILYKQFVWTWFQRMLSSLICEDYFINLQDLAAHKEALIELIAQHYLKIGLQHKCNLMIEVENTFVRQDIRKINHS